jgi:hypothetical protein
VPGGCATFRDQVELASAAFGQAAVSVTPLQMALMAATIANNGAVPQPFVVRDVRSHAAVPAGGPTDDVLEEYDGGRGSQVISSQVAAQVRQAMIDAVSGPIGRLYAGPGDVARFHLGDRDRHDDRRARPRPEAAFVVYRLRAGTGWRTAVDRHRRHRRGRRNRDRPRRADRWRDHGRVAQADRGLRNAIHTIPSRAVDSDATVN